MPGMNRIFDCGVGVEAGVGAGGDAATACVDGVSDIRLSKKYRKGLRRLAYAATAKSLGVYSRSS